MPSGDQLKYNPKLASERSKKQKGRKQLKTIIRQTKGIEDFKRWQEAFFMLIALEMEIADGDDKSEAKDSRRFLMQHCMKHFIPIKREDTIDLTSKTIVNITTVSPSNDGKRD